MFMNPFFVTDFSISDSLKTVRKSVLIYETIIFVKDIAGIQIEEEWITGDVRPGRGEERWLNILVR